MSVSGKIKIVYVMTSCRKDGPIQQSLNIIKNLDSKKFEPILITIYEERKGNSRLNEFLSYVSKHYLVPMSKFDIMVGRTSKMSKILDKLKPDVIHTLGVFPDYLISSLELHGHILTLRNYAPDDYPDKYGKIKGKILTRMQVKAAKKADTVVACSKTLQDIYKKKLGIETVCIQNGVDTEKYVRLLDDDKKESIRKKAGVSDSDFIWIYSGQFIDRKNVPFMIEGFLKARNESDKLLLLGSGEKFDEIRNKYTDKNSLIFMGAVDNVGEYLNIADAYISASRSEGLPNGVMEAMACGLPVLLSDIPQHRELLVDGKESGGAIFKLNDMNDYINKLKLMRSKNLFAMGEFARKNIEKNFDSKKMSGKYQEIYAKITEPEFRVTLFISSLSVGGAERVTCNLANYLCRHGCLVDVITMSNMNDTYRLDEGVNRVCLLDEKERRLGKLRNFWIRRRRLKEYVRMNQDVSSYVVMLPITTFMLIRLKKFTKAKMTISERNNPESYSLLKKMIMKYSAKRCDGLVVQTKEIGEWYNNVKNKVVIPNAINEDVVLPKREKIEKQIVAVGRLEQQKNYPMLIEAFKIFSEKYPEYKLEIYGQGSQEKKIRRMVDEYELNDRVIFMGYVKNVSERIVNAACFVMTSNYEGISNALIEAMCMGIPCVVTDSDGGGARELIRNGKNGFLVEKNAIDELVEKIELIINSKDLSKQITKNALEVRPLLSPNVIYNKWLGFIEEVGGRC